MYVCFRITSFTKIMVILGADVQEKYNNHKLEMYKGQPPCSSQTLSSWFNPIPYGISIPAILWGRGGQGAGIPPSFDELGHKIESVQLGKILLYFGDFEKSPNFGCTVRTLHFFLLFFYFISVSYVTLCFRNIFQLFNRLNNFCTVTVQKYLLCIRDLTSTKFVQKLHELNKGTQM